MEVDIEEVGLTLSAANDVGVPDLLGERLRHRRSAPVSCPVSWGVLLVAGAT
jgi:hypothetical protein